LAVVRHYFRYKDDLQFQALADMAALSVAHTRDAAELTKRILLVLDKLRSPTKQVFIAHGGEVVWEVLRRHLREKHQLEVEEFEETPVAGQLTGDRITAMLNAAEFAFIVMTAEDEWPDGTKHARENVIHEAGLFQAKLGFDNAILLIEDGCTRFSNIQGLQFIKFRKNKMADAFPEIDQVLKRAGLIAAP
jgi:predicted nucleotide-binding protein